MRALTRPPPRHQALARPPHDPTHAPPGIGCEVGRLGQNVRLSALCQGKLVKGTLIGQLVDFPFYAHLVYSCVIKITNS
jgi:hypothetical protein